MKCPKCNVELVRLPDPIKAEGEKRAKVTYECENCGSTFQRKKGRQKPWYVLNPDGESICTVGRKEDAEQIAAGLNVLSNPTQAEARGEAIAYRDPATGRFSRVVPVGSVEGGYLSLRGEGKLTKKARAKIEAKGVKKYKWKGRVISEKEGVFWIMEKGKKKTFKSKKKAREHIAPPKKAKAKPKPEKAPPKKKPKPKKAPKKPKPKKKPAKKAPEVQTFEARFAEAAKAMKELVK